MKSTHSSPEKIFSSPNLYNMGGLNPRTIKNPLFSAGLGWLTINCQVDWAEKWGTDRLGGQTLSEKLNDLAATARETGAPVEVEEWNAKVHPDGGKIGGVKYCKYKIERAACIILIADSPKYSGDWPNVNIEIDGEHGLESPGGAEAAYRAAINWLESLGASIHKERISRAIFCADFPCLSMDTFKKAYRLGRWACRARDHQSCILSGFSLNFGSGDIKLRIYDKLAEMKASILRGQTAEYEHMIQTRWGGIVPESASRVEFQLGWTWLKSHGANTVDDLLRLAPEFIGYLTGTSNARWFRFLRGKQDNKHSERNKVLPEWESVQSAFAEVFKCPKNSDVIDPDKADIETLLKQALGRLEMAAAKKGFDLPWKTTTAPAKHNYPNYEAFEEWMNVMLRNVVAKDSRWSFKKSPNDGVSFDYGIFIRKFEKKHSVKKHPSNS